MGIAGNLVHNLQHQNTIQRTPYMTSRLLLVEPSATMRYVLENYAQSLGFGVVAVGDYKQAEEALHQQFRSYGGDFACVLLGWSIVPDAGADALIATLESQDFVDLPVVVMSTDMRAETRAWVAGREHTAVLAWKEYQSIDGLLQRLLQSPVDANDTFTSKFDNADINVLIVDDSVSIRFALRDLFELQGYKVSVASGHDEALAIAQQSSFDIAVLDFYLQDGTGDVLCRKLIADPKTGHLTCAMLTGTYADHIIKRSLRAGAVECMFKNESSELLLARIDALSRFVRQRKKLAIEQRRLDELVDALAGATIVIDGNDVISYASQQASSLLGFDSQASMLGLKAGQIVDLGIIKQASAGKFRNQWRDATQGLINVVYRQLVLEDSSDIVLNFKLLPGGAVAQKPVAVSSTATDIVSTLQLPHSSMAFVTTLKTYLDNVNSKSESVSFLVIDTFAATANAEMQPSNRIDGLAHMIEAALKNVYKRENHVAKLGDNRYGFLLRHTTEPQAYLLTRKIMQVYNALDTGVEGMTLSSTGCLLGLSVNKDKSAAQVLRLSDQGLEVVNQRGKNQALLLDLRRMLPVYASSQKS